jgi:hypothetical protein
MKTLDVLKAELETAQQAVNAIRAEIQSLADGFTYVVCILSYGSKSWQNHHVNTFALQELCYEYGDGYDGLVHIYSNNPKLAGELDHMGCLTTFTLEELPENKRDVSRTEGLLSFIKPY